MTIMEKKKKKKGRPSLLDLKKRSLKQQQQQSLSHNQTPDLFDFSPNPSGRSTLRFAGDEAAYSAPGFIAGDADDDDERKEKKHRLVNGLNSDSEANRATLSLNSSVALGSDSNADGDDPDVALKRRKISDVFHGSDHMSGKVLKATGNSIVHGSQVESGPTATPLPDQKLLLFILDRLQKKDTYGVFSDPVDPDELPDYHEIIENPMDFSTVRKKLDSGAYSNLEQFENDVMLICSNAMEYNSPDTVFFRQARSIQELAKKDFENLREESDDDSDPPPAPPPPPKIVRRGRPPGKKIKKMESYSLECVGPEIFSDTTASLVEENEHLNGTNGYNLRKNPPPNKFRPSDTVNGSFRVSLGTETYPSWVSDLESEFPASVVRSVQKYGMKHFPVDENKRNTYRFCSELGDETSALALLKVEQKTQLVEVGGAFLGCSYAQSLARFAEELGPVVWKVASKKIESTLAVDTKFSTVQNEASLGHESLPFEQKKCTPNRAADELAQRLLPQSAMTSNLIQGSNNQSQLSLLSGGTRHMTPSQIGQNSSLQPCTSNSNNDHFVYFPHQMGMSRPQILVPPQMLGIVRNEANLSSRFLPQVQGVSELRTISDASLHYPKHDSQSFASDSNAEFWAPDSPNPSSVAQIGSPQHPHLALDLRMSW